MKTAIIYYSRHHENTKKLLEAIYKWYPDIALIDITKQENIDLTLYDRIGFASGIYYSKFQKRLIELAKEKMPEGKETFFIYTCAAKKKGYTKAISEAVKVHHASILGEYGCYGFNTYGPFKLIGGMKKGHPNEEEIENAIKFYEGL